MLMPEDRENVHLRFALVDGMHDFFQFQLKGVQLELLSMTCSAPLPPAPPPETHTPTHTEGTPAPPDAELPGTDQSNGVSGSPIVLVPDGPSVGPQGSEKASQQQQGLSAGLVFGIGLCTAVGLYACHRRNAPHGIWSTCASMRQVRIEIASDLEMPETSQDMPSDAEDEASSHADEPPQRAKNGPSPHAASKKMPGVRSCRKYDDLEEEADEEDSDHVNRSTPPRASGRNGKPRRGRKG